jgi:hypothetical protein
MRRQASVGAPASERAFAVCTLHSRTENDATWHGRWRLAASLASSTAQRQWSGRHGDETKRVVSETKRVVSTRHTRMHRGSVEAERRRQWPPVCQMLVKMTSAWPTKWPAGGQSHGASRAKSSLQAKAPSQGWRRWVPTYDVQPLGNKRSWRRKRRSRPPRRVVAGSTNDARHQLSYDALNGKRGSIQ